MSEHQVICVANQKGGVAKSVTCQHLAYSLAEMGRTVLAVDFDPQTNLTATLSTNVDALPPYDIGTLLDCLLRDDELPQKCEYIASHGKIDFIPGSKDLSRLESVLQSEMGTERFLQVILEPLRAFYDYIIIDTNRATSPLMVNALTATDSVLIPITPEFYSTEGLSDLITTVFKNKRRLNPHIEFAGILFTMCDFRTNLYHSTRKDVEDAFAGEIRVFKAAIPRTVQVGEAVQRGMTALEYDKNSKAGQAYMDFAKELMESA